MNYYERHLGDYARDTGHLSLLEHGVYTLLLDAYYSREKPLPADPRECCKLARAVSKADKAAVAYILREFFTESPEGYRQARADAEIARFKEKQRKAAASANARWSKSDGNANASPDAMRTHSEGNALQSPVSSNQSPSSEARLPRAEARAALSADFGSWVQRTYPQTSHTRKWSDALHFAHVIVDGGKVTEADLRRRVEGYRAFVDGRGVSDPSKVITPQNWFNPQAEDAGWSREWAAPPSKAQQAQDANISASQQWLAQGNA